MVDVGARFRYTADFSPVQAQVRALSRDIAMLNASFVSLDRAAMTARRDIAESFASNINATGQFKASFVDLTSATEQFGRAIERRTLSLREYFREARRVYQQDSMGARLAERQVRQRQAQVIGLGAGPGGRQQAMVVTPLQLDTSDFNTKMQIAAEKYAVFNRLVDDGATKLINWGKNTQWAGRQLTVGLTMPLVLFGAAVSKTFRDVDKELTRFAKVYGSDLVGANSAATEAMKRQIQSLAVEYSRAYGVAAKETAALAADLAATGLEGDKLLGAVAQTTRLAVLGEVERQDAMQTTLALQSAFQQSTKELADSINFLNAVENQTSASLQDFTAAIPKAGPVVRQLGGDVKDLAVMLTAMREGGIPAAEAANAIKSGLASMINPTKAASERLAKLGVDIEGIVNRNRGELMPTLMEFSGVINQLDSFARAKVIEELFGKYQFARISALFDNLNRQGSQTAQVLELMGASSADLAKIANKEIGALTESLSMRFTRAIEGFKAALLPIGEVLTSSIIPFIEGATTVIGKMIEVFNALPEPVKNAGKFLLGLTAAAGPLIMLAGVFGNFLGYMTKGILKLNNFARMLMGLPTHKLEILDDQTVAAAKATDILTDSFNREASSLQVLNAHLQTYLANLRRAATTDPNLFVPGSPARPGRHARPPVRRSSGGDIPGYGGGDKVPALLEPGEFVVRKEVANKNRGFLRSLNAGKVQRFFDGGDVLDDRENIPEDTRSTNKVFAHTVASGDEDADGNKRYYGVGFDVDPSINTRLNKPGQNPVSKDEFIAAIRDPESTDTMKSLLKKLPNRLTDAQIDLIVDEYKNELIRKIGTGPEPITDPDLYEKSREILTSNGPGSRLIREGMKIGIDARPGVSLRKLAQRGVDTANARKFASARELQSALGISLPPRDRPEPLMSPPKGWAYQYIDRTDAHPAYLIQREIESRGTWGPKYAVYEVAEDGTLTRLGRSGAGERDTSRYKPFAQITDPGEPRTTIRPTTPSQTTSTTTPTRPTSGLGPRGRIAAGMHPTTRFGRRPIVRAMPGEVMLPPTAYADNGAIVDKDGSVSPLQQRRGMMGSSLMNIGFAGSMLAGMTAMNGEVTAATAALSAFTTALMVAGTAVEMGQMFGGRRGAGAKGAGLLGMSGLGRGMIARGGTMKAAGAAGGGIGGFLKSGAGMGMMGAGRALVMAGGPYGMAIAAAIAVAVGAIIQFNRILQNMKDSAKAAFAEPTKSAEYFGIELGRNAERAQEFGEIVERLGLTASKTADQIDQDLVQRVGEDYDSLISRLKGSKDTQAVGNDLKLAYSSMIAQGFGEEEAATIVEEIARQAEQRPIFLSIKGELEMIGDDPEQVAKSIAENSAKALQFAKQQVQQNFQKEVQETIPGVIKDFALGGMVGSAIPALFNGKDGQFLDFAGSFDATKDFFGRMIDPTKRFSTEMQAALSTVENAGEMFGASMNTLFEQFKQFPQETGPAMQTVLGYVEALDEGQREAFDTAVAKNFTENVADPALLLFYENLGNSNEDLSLKMKLAQAASLGLADGLSGLMSQGKLTEAEIDKLVQQVILLDKVNREMDDAIQEGIDAMKKQSREVESSYAKKTKEQEKIIKNLEKEAEIAQENHDDYMDSLEDESRALDDRADKIQENAEKQQELIDKKIKTLQLSQEEATFDQQQRERAFGLLGALMSGDAIGYEQARLEYTQAEEDRQRELAIQGLEDKKEDIADEAQRKLDAIDKEKRAIEDRARAAQDAHEAYMEQNQENQEAAAKRIEKLEREKNKTLKGIQAQINLLEEYKAQGYLTEQQVSDINDKLKKMGARLPAGIRTTLQDITTGMFGPNGEYTKIVNGLIQEMATALNVSPDEVRNMLGNTLAGQYSYVNIPAGHRGAITGTGITSQIPGDGSTPALAGGGQPITPKGKVHGKGTQTSDSILAFLSKDEYVVKADSVNRVGTDALDYINSTGTIPGFAQGTPGGVGAAQQAGGFWGTGPNAMTVLSIRALQDLYGQAVSSIQNTPTTTTTPGSIPAGEGSQWLANFLASMGLSGEQLRVAYAIAMRESSGQPGLVSTMDGNGYGLFQIQFGVGHANTINSVLGTNITDNEIDRQRFAQAMFDPINNFKVMMHMSRSLEDLGAWGLHSWRNPTLNTRDYSGWTSSQHQAWIMEPFLRYYSSFPGVDSNYYGSTTTGQGGSTAAGQAAVNFATSQQGKPYSMTATPPSSWDCSKLTAWAWAVATGADPARGYNDPNAKVKLTPYSHTQANQISKRVVGNGGPISGLVPGDVLYFRGMNSQSGGHTSIYVGNGQVFEAASPSLGLKYEDVNNAWNQQYFAWAGSPPGYAEGGLVDGFPIGDKPKAGDRKKPFIPGFEIGTPGGVYSAAARQAGYRTPYRPSPTYYGSTTNIPTRTGVSSSTYRPSADTTANLDLYRKTPAYATSSMVQDFLYNKYVRKYGPTDRAAYDQAIASNRASSNVGGKRWQTLLSMYGNLSEMGAFRRQGISLAAMGIPDFNYWRGLSREQKDWFFQYGNDGAAFLPGNQRVQYHGSDRTKTFRVMAGIKNQRIQGTPTPVRTTSRLNPADDRLAYYNKGPILPNNSAQMPPFTFGWQDAARRGIIERRILPEYPWDNLDVRANHYRFLNFRPNFTWGVGIPGQMKLGPYGEVYRYDGLQGWVKTSMFTSPQSTTDQLSIFPPDNKMSFFEHMMMQRDFEERSALRLYEELGPAIGLREGGTADRQEGYSYTSQTSRTPYYGSTTTSSTYSSSTNPYSRYTYTPGWNSSRYGLPAQRYGPYGTGRVPGTTKPFVSPSMGRTADLATMLSHGYSHKLGAYATSAQYQQFLNNKFNRKTGGSERVYVPGYGYVGGSAKTSGKKWQSLMSLISSPFGGMAKQRLSSSVRDMPTQDFWRTLSREQKAWLFEYATTGKTGNWSNEKIFRLMPWLPPAAPKKEEQKLFGGPRFGVPEKLPQALLSYTNTVTIDGANYVWDGATGQYIKLADVGRPLGGPPNLPPSYEKPQMKNPDLAGLVLGTARTSYPWWWDIKTTVPVNTDTQDFGNWNFDMSTRSNYPKSYMGDVWTDPNTNTTYYWHNLLGMYKNYPPITWGSSPGQGMFAGGIIKAKDGTFTSDSVLAKVSRGEYVVNAFATASVGKETLDYINENGNLPGLAKGGMPLGPKFKVPASRGISPSRSDRMSSIRQGDIIYNINVDVAETNASPEDIANRVLRQIKTNQNARRLRSNG